MGGVLTFESNGRAFWHATWERMSFPIHTALPTTTAREKSPRLKDIFCMPKPEKFCKLPFVFEEWDNEIPAADVGDDRYRNLGIISHHYFFLMLNVDSRFEVLNQLLLLAVRTVPCVPQFQSSKFLKIPKIWKFQKIWAHIIYLESETWNCFQNTLLQE